MGRSAPSPHALKNSNHPVWRPDNASAAFPLKHVPKELVVYLVVELHLRSFHEGTQRSRATVRRGLLQVRVAPLYVFAEEFGRPFGGTEMIQRRVDIVGQITLRLP